MNTYIDPKRCQDEVLHGSASSVTYLDHDQCEGENVRFLGVSPPFQDLRRTPSHGEAALRRGTAHRIRVLSDYREAKVYDACTARVVHEDVLLVGYQHNGEVGAG